MQWKKEGLGDLGCPIFFQMPIFFAASFTKSTLKIPEWTKKNLNFQSKYALTKLIWSFLSEGIFLTRLQSNTVLETIEMKKMF